MAFSIQQVNEPDYWYHVKSSMSKKQITFDELVKAMAKPFDDILFAGKHLSNEFYRYDVVHNMNPICYPDA